MKKLVEDLLLLGKQLREEELDKICEAILALEGGRQWTIPEVAERLEQDKKLVSLALMKLETEGRIRGFWTL